METTQDQVTTKNPAFPFKSWLVWFFLLLLPPVVVLVLLILDQSSFPQSIQGGSYSFITYTFYLLPFLVGCIQWLYLRTRLPRALFWIPMQILIYTLVAFGLVLFVIMGFYNFAQNFSNPERFVSFCLLMLIFLLPGALLHFAYFRVKRVPVSWSWFRDYALVFAIGAVGYLFYDALRFGQPPFIPVLRGQHYFDLAVFVLYTSAGVAWVMARVPFPGVVKNPRPKKNLEPTRSLEKYRKKGTFARLMYWFNGLFIPGMILFITFTELMSTTPDGLTSIVAISIASSLFIIAEWWLFRCLVPVSKKNFALQALFIPVVFLVGLIPGLSYEIEWTAILVLSLLALLAIGFFQQVGLRRVGFRLNRFYFLYLLAAFLLCLLPLVMPETSEDVWFAFELIAGLFFSTVCALLLSFLIHPVVFPPGPDQSPLVEKSPDEFAGGKEK